MAFPPIISLALALMWSLVKYAALFLVSLVFLLGVGAPTNLSSTFAWQFRLAARLRTPVLVFVVVPLSFVRWAYREVRGRARDFLRYYGGRNGEEEVRRGHEERVERVVRAVKAWNEAGGRVRKQTDGNDGDEDNNGQSEGGGGNKGSLLRTARPTWMGMSVHISGKEDAHRVEVHHLDYVLSVNDDGTEEPSVTVEPGVTMGDLTRLLLPRNLMLDLHVEMESVTVGGAAMGFGIETNSHQTGFFQETVLSYEMVDSNGNVRKVDRENCADPELFHALPWSHGSLGFLTCLTVRCVRVKPYVNVRYIPTQSPEELTAKLRTLTEGEPRNCPRFVEATVFSKDEAVIQVGDYCTLDEAPPGAKVHEINHFWKPFYYKYVQSLLREPSLPSHPEGACRSEVIPLRHYTHRFTRSVFWELEDMIPFSNHPLYRTMWGWLGAPEVGLLKLAQGPVIRQASVEAHVVQESIAPLRHLADCVRGFDRWFGVYPLLAFPVRVYDRGELSGFLRPRKDDLLPGKDYGMYVDLGAYGVPRPVKVGMPWEAKPNVRAMEEWTRERGGFQALYTDVFHTRREFRKMFDHDLLDRVRGREGIDADGAFAEVYDRVRSRYANLEEEERKEEEEEEERRKRERGDAEEGVDVAGKGDCKSNALSRKDSSSEAAAVEGSSLVETDQSSKASTTTSSSRASSSASLAGSAEVPSSVGDAPWQWISRKTAVPSSSSTMPSSSSTSGDSSRLPSHVSEGTNAPGC